MTDIRSFIARFPEPKMAFDLQREAAEALGSLSFPTTRDEQWKYTRVAPVVKPKYTIDDTQKRFKPEPVEGLDAIEVLITRGVVIISEDLPKGIEILSLTEAAEEHPKLVRTYLGKYAPHSSEAFVALNSFMFFGGLFIHIDKGVELRRPIRINLNVSGEQVFGNPRTLIVAEANSKASVIHSFTGTNAVDSFTNAVTEIVVNKGASLEYDLIQNEGEHSRMVTNTHAAQQADSHFSINTITKSGDWVRNNLHIALQGEGCTTNLYGLYFTSGTQHVDNHTYMDHQKANCQSNERYKGVMDGKSVGVFNGKIYVHREAQQTNAFQSNQNIVMTDTAKVNTKPELEIYADDVKCSHGCTTGQLDDEALFYLRSRGLGKREASQLLIRAFATDVLENISIEALREDIERFVESKFDNANA